jgi:hypothetical protein
MQQSYIFKSITQNTLISSAKRGHLECLYNFSIVKPTRCTHFSNLLNITLHVSDGLSVHHQEFKTVNTPSGICHTGSVAACKQAATEPVWHTPDGMFTVLNSWWWTERPSEICRMIFNKLEKIVHLVGFTIEIYHDARSQNSAKNQ